MEEKFEVREMPRHARLDAAGTLHHIMVRGIEKERIFDDYLDREGFVTGKQERGTPVIFAISKDEGREED